MKPDPSEIITREKSLPPHSLFRLAAYRPPIAFRLRHDLTKLHPGLGKTPLLVYWMRQFADFSLNDSLQKRRYRQRPEEQSCRHECRHVFDRL